MSDWSDRFEACLTLGALGDIMGSALEGTPIADREIDRSIGWLTDDTVLTIATATSIANTGRVDPEGIAESFVNVYRQGIPGLGSSTLGALQALSAGQHWALAGISGDRAAGNGAAMRIAPVAFLLDPHDPGARQTILDVARITHRNDEAAIGALAFAFGIHRALSGPLLGASNELALIAKQLPDTRVRDQIAVAANLEAAAPSDAAQVLGSSGYVAESVPLSLWIGLQPWFSPVQVIEAAALAAEDADTVASLVGQLLGAAGHRKPAGEPDPLVEYDVRGIAKRLEEVRHG